MHSFDIQDLFYSYSPKIPSLTAQSRGTLELSPTLTFLLYLGQGVFAPQAFFLTFQPY